MKNKNLIKYFIPFAFGLAFFACKKTQFDTIKRSQGDADFTNYVSVGNSLTQGYQDGGLYADGQQNSFPSMIAAQMKIANPI